jgi:hypothetical protein
VVLVGVEVRVECVEVVEGTVVVEGIVEIAVAVVVVGIEVVGGIGVVEGIVVVVEDAVEERWESRALQVCSGKEEVGTPVIVQKGNWGMRAGWRTFLVARQEILGRKEDSDLSVVGGWKGNRGKKVCW